MAAPPAGRDRPTRDDGRAASRLDVSRTTQEERDVLCAALRAYERALRARLGRDVSVRVARDATWRAWIAADLIRQVVDR
jgi:hypothetical protein